jgi:8-oxo-dGTP pyrophosphatase MutT (NUDIX family)
MAGNSQKGNTCSNCGLYGHHYKNCTEPITSYGIIAFRIKDESWNPNEMLLKNDEFPTNQVEYLLIQRRDSIGFIELLRAKYKLTDIEYIRDQIAGITERERTALIQKTFDELWVNLWGKPTVPENKQYKQEYDLAKQKFEVLKHGYEHNGTFFSLKKFIETTPILYDSPEWGFPKGRRNVFETNYACAVREFCEETGLQPTDVKVFEQVEPLRETFYGNNNIHYSHIYYIGWIQKSTSLEMKCENAHMMREIGNIGWFSYEEAIQKIRPNNIEKKKVLSQVSTLLSIVQPLYIGYNKNTSKSTFEIEPSIVNRNRGNESRNPWTGGGKRTTPFKSTSS